MSKVEFITKKHWTGLQLTPFIPGYLPPNRSLDQTAKAFGQLGCSTHYSGASWPSVFSSDARRACRLPWPLSTWLCSWLFRLCCRCWRGIWRLPSFRNLRLAHDTAVLLFGFMKPRATLFTARRDRPYAAPFADLACVQLEPVDVSASVPITGAAFRVLIVRWRALIAEA